METVLIRERYKVVRVLCAYEDYACVEAVDIQDRETPVCTINLYEGEQFHRYGKIYASMRPENCPALRRLFLDGQTVAAVFEYKPGDNIDQLFYPRDRWDWRARLDYAEALLHAAMALYNLPPELSCAIMFSENLFFAHGEAKVRFRYMVPPMEEMNERELTLLAEDQLRKILTRRFESPAAELDFMERLDEEGLPNIVRLYGAWHDVEGMIREEYEEWESKSLIGRWISQILMRIKRRLKRR